MVISSDKDGGEDDLVVKVLAVNLGDLSSDPQKPHKR